MKQRLKQMLCLPERFHMYASQSLEPRGNLQEVVLFVRFRNQDFNLSNLIEVKTWLCLTILKARNLALTAESKRQVPR